MSDRALVSRARLLMECLAVMYMVANAAAAQYGGGYYLLFPGLAALSHEVLTRPWGKWACQPGRLVLTPTLGAAVGTLITREFPYDVLTILFVVAACLLLLALLRSHIAPTIAAGALPLTLGTKSWLYPVSIALALIALAGILLLRQKCYFRKHQGALEVSSKDLDDTPEAPPGGHKWMLAFFLFITAMAACGAAMDVRLILFPPLIVMAYDMFAHPTSCPWAQKPLALPVACLLTATGGWLAVSQFGRSGIAAGCGMIIGIVVLRLLELHMAPALGVALLPLVIDAPDITYPVSVGIGTVALTLAFLLYRRWITGQGRVDKSVSIL